MNACSHCNAENETGRKFCGQCGQTLMQRCNQCNYTNSYQDRFCGGCGAQLQAAAQNSVNSSTQSTDHGQNLPSASVPERRYLSILFCDLVGSTALSARLDPEDMRQVIRGYQRVASTAIYQYEGYIARFMGDGIMAYFGYPVAHENDTERALLAGLDVIKAVKALNQSTDSVPDVEYQVRIGVASGRVVVGDLIGEGSAAEEKAVIGETPNLAARLQSIAEPNSLVIGQTSESVVRGLFTLESIGEHKLKGFSNPIAAWRVLGAKIGFNRFRAIRGNDILPLMSREQELALLYRRWSQAVAGQGRIVLVTAESGFGKSRLVASISNDLAIQKIPRVHLHCSPFHRNTALFPFIQLIEKFAEIRRNESPHASLTKLDAAFSPKPGDKITVPLIAQLLSIPLTGDEYDELNLSPEEIRRKTLDLLIALFLQQTRDNPVLLVFEDLHWIDPTSKNLLLRFLAQSHESPALVLMTQRPEGGMQDTQFDNMDLIYLDRLDDQASTELIFRAAGSKHLPPQVVQQIISRSDGVPLYLEELTRAAITLDLLDEQGEQFTLRGSLPSVAIPATLQESLLARFSKFNFSKEIAQIGSTIGRDFSFDLLLAVSGFVESQIASALEQLCDGEVLAQNPSSSTASYQFKHALLQEAAYKSLLRSRRQALHAKTAQTIESLFPQQAKTEPEVVAHHYAMAQQYSMAIQYWTLASKQALQRSANKEVIAHVGEALALLEKIPKDRESLIAEMELQLILGAASRAYHGFASESAETAFSQAAEICRELQNGTLLIEALRGLYTVYYVRGDLKNAIAQAKQVVALNATLKLGQIEMLGNLMSGCIEFWMGNFSSSEEKLNKSLELYEPLPVNALNLSGQLDPRVSALTHLCWLKWISGYPDQSARMGQEAITLARSLGQPLGLALALYWSGSTLICAGDFNSAAKITPELKQLTQHYDISFLTACGTVNEGLIECYLEDASLGLSRIEKAFEDFRSQGAQVGRPWAISLPVSLLIKTGQLERAELLLNSAVMLIQKNQEKQWEAEILRLKGELAAVRGNTDEALQWYQQSLTLAIQQRALSLQLRTTLSMAEIWKKQGEENTALVTLKKAYKRFTEGFSTADLQRAKAMIEQLSH